MQAATSDPRAAPVWQLKIGDSVWLRLPAFPEVWVGYFYAFAGIFLAVHSGIDLIARPGWHWILVTESTIGGLQAALGVASLWASHLQKRRAASGVARDRT
jgi:hypothetical protein